MAFFGLKDLQQYMLIRQMVRDLSMQIKVVGIETMRTDSGLALSSRNERLSSHEKEVAACIYAGLKRAKDRLSAGKSPAAIMTDLGHYYHSIDELEIEYCELVNPETMQVVDAYENLNSVAICVAGFVGGVRLIDNVYLRLD
jgi:pantoate--beta-alanine ligase